MQDTSRDKGSSGQTGLRARAISGTALTVVSFGGQNALRLASNLILTRLLFPEDFGLMALVQVVIAGLGMFSDIGLHAAIVQDKRGDDPVFLNTAWTLQIGRGVLLWIVILLLAVPVAGFYEAPLLAQLLPVAGLVVVIQGMNSMRMATANRSLHLGRLTAMTLGTKAFGVVVTVLLALWLQSVWALVLGSLVGTSLLMLLSHIVLPGHRDRLHFEMSAAGQLFRFGGYIFLATIAGFFVNQGDRAILGKFVSLDVLAIYNIGLFIATVPVMVGRAVMRRVMFPLYARRPPSEHEDNALKIAKARRLCTAALLAFSAVMALVGVPLIEILYDARYHGAAPVASLVALAYLPVVITVSYHNLPLAAGHSGRFAALVTGIALMQTAALFLGLSLAGLGGAILAPGLAAILAYPAMVWLIRPYRSWDPLHDAVAAGAMLAIIAATLALHGAALEPLFRPL